ncbi:MAG: T9SS type A sorting domain-containing protein [Ignavibacteriae bacterium]|nr:T9SS type A sorting domain-containing protein [Ignavibacteriota bacterium]
MTAARLTSLPNAKFFGKTTAGLFGAIAELDINGCYFRCQIQDSYYTNDPYEYLSGTEFPVDEKVWLTKDDVALGEDKVVKEALNWINNLANSHNAKIDKTYSNDEVTFTADVLNPNGQELSIIANIKNDSLIVESLNCEIKNGKINETIDISAYPEDLYSVTIKTENQFDYNIHTLPNIVRFTNAGPVKIDTFKASFNDSLVLISDLYLRNLGTSKELKNIRLDLLSIDSTVSRITTSYTTYNNISPGETGKSKTFLKYYTKDVSDTNNFIVEIAIDKVKYWEDTLIVIPPKPSDIALLDKLPTEYSLEQNYPNPFNPSTVIKYSIPANSVIARSDATWQSAEITSGNSFPRNDNVNVSLKVYDILGREIATLVNQKQKPGFYEVKLDGSDLSSGIYFYRITAGDYVESKKMVLLK